VTSFKGMELFNKAIVRLYLRTSSLDGGKRLLDRNMPSCHQVRCNHGGAPRDTHETVHQHATSALHGISDEATCLGKVDKDVIVFVVMDGYNHVVRPLEGIILAHGYDVRDAILAAEVDRLGCGEISNVEPTIYDGVDVTRGSVRHVREGAARNGVE